MATKRESALGFIFVTLLIDVIGLGIIIPVLPKLITQLIGGDPNNMSVASRYGGLLMFAYAAMQFLFAPVLGNLSDRYGRRKVLLFSLLGFGVDYLFSAFAPSIGWLFAGRILAGITGASFTTASAYIADISTPEKRAQNFGMIGAAFGLGFIIGPLLGGLLGDLGSKIPLLVHYGMDQRLPFLAAAFLSLLNATYGYFILPESLKPENRRPFEWKRASPIGSLMLLKRYPVISGLVISLVCLYIAGHATQSTWTFFTIEKFHWKSGTVGISLAVVGVLIAVVQGGLIRVITPKIGQKNSVYVGLILYTIGNILLAFASAGWMAFVFLIPYCLGGIANPALQGIISTQVPGNEQGELQGALTSLMSVTSIIGPLLMTSLFSYFTAPGAPVYFPGVPFMAAAVLVIISLFLIMRSLADYIHQH